MNRQATIANLLNSDKAWDIRTGEIMQANPTLNRVRASIRAHDELVAEADRQWREQYDENGRPKAAEGDELFGCTGSAARWIAANVGLN